MTTADSSSPATTTSSSPSSTSSPPHQNPPPWIMSSSSSSLPFVPQSHFKGPEDQELIRLALHKSPFFTCLDEEQVERLVRVAQKRVYEPGTVVILEGCVDSNGDEADKLDDEQQAVHDEPIHDSATAAMDCTDTKEDEEAHMLPNERQMADARDDEEEVDVDATTSSSAETAQETTQSAQHIVMEKIEPIEPTNDDSFTVAPDHGSVPAAADHEGDATTSEEGEEETNDDNRIGQQGSTKGRSSKDTGQGERRIRSIYIVRKGKADVWYNHHPRGDNDDATTTDLVSPASLGPGTVVGEGGFLFGRQHSASVVASSGPLECWVVDWPTFRDQVLPSRNMTQLFQQYATQYDEEKNVPYMSMDDFVRAEQREDAASSSSDGMSALPDPALVSLQIANTYNILSSTQPRSSAAATTTPPLHSAAAAPPRIYLHHFCLFHLLMARPDPEVDIAFLLMDQRQTGQICLEDVKDFVEPAFPGLLDYNADFFQRYFGRQPQRQTTITGDSDDTFSSCCIRATHFSQFLMDLQREMGKQTFLRAVENHPRRSPTSSESSDGTSQQHVYLAPAEFVQVLKTACGWRLPQGVVDRLESIYCHGPIQAGEATAQASLRAGTLKGHKTSTREIAKRTEASVLAEMEQRENSLGDRNFSYPDFLAYQEVLANLPGICNLIDRAQEIKNGEISPDDFKVANRVLGLGGRLSRRQVDIVFLLFDLDRDGYISHEDTVSVCGVDLARRLVAVKGRQGRLTFAPPPEYRQVPEESTEETAKDEDETQVVGFSTEWMKHWGLTAVAGALGVVALYPVDLIKTRLMNQRISSDGKRMYANSLDCLRRAIRVEGALGLYRGLAPQFLGVAPEKAIKLQVNDLLRQVWSSRDEETGKPKINLSLEVLAGACAGACQLLVSNPMEITKIRLQVQGETDRLLRSKGLKPPAPQSFVGVLRDLGFPGVYRGASACLLRDVPFSAIYFPSYAYCKELLAERNEIPGYTTPSDLLLAGSVAGIPAALLTAPADVIKTRLQSIPRPGEVAYSGIRDCATKIYQQEGWSGFLQGAGPRILRIAPQFGISLLAYEQLAQMVGLHEQVPPAPPTNAFVDPYDYRTAFPARSIQPKASDIHSWIRTYGKPAKKPPEPGDKE